MSIHRVERAEDLINVAFEWNKITWSNDKAMEATPFPEIVSNLLDATSHPLVPFLSVVLYLLLSGPVCSSLVKAGLVSKSTLKLLTVLHNIILTVYSGATFYYSATASFAYYTDKTNNDLYAMLCDRKGEVWHKFGLGFWISHFYLSKYYEFVDTWIIHLNSKTPMLLQTYHHAGIVVLMWSFVVTNNTNCGLVVTVLNSFTHTIMYAYFTAAALGHRSPLAKILTSMQLVQFVVGIAITVPPLFMSDCLTEAQKTSTILIHIYTIILIGLFYNFYVNRYSKKSDKKSA